MIFHWGFLSFRKGGKPSSASAGTVEKKKQLPLSKILRMLWMKVHPDLMTKFPQMKKANEDSLAQLNTFLSSIKDRDGNNAYPKAQHQSIIFYLLTDKEAHFRKVQLDLHTNGGACKALVSTVSSPALLVRMPAR